MTLGPLRGATSDGVGWALPGPTRPGARHGR
jgi:hypothetical protein